MTICVADMTTEGPREGRRADTSVSALVKQFLTELAASESDIERLKREERALRERISNFRAADRLPREDVHRRHP